MEIFSVKVFSPFFLFLGLSKMISDIPVYFLKTQFDILFITICNNLFIKTADAINQSCNVICFWYIHCLWYIHCALFMYIIATLVFLSSHTVSPSPTLLLPFIGYCLVSVTCLRVFCGIFSSNMRFSFFSPPFSTSTLGTNLLLPVLIKMFIICTACSSPFFLSNAVGGFQFWECLWLNHILCSVIVFLDSLTSEYF